MITLEQCVASTGLAPGELCLGSTPSTKHRALLGSYLLNLKRGPEFVREMMVSDLRRWLDLGAVEQAADLLIVLRQFLTAHPEARFVRCSARGGRLSPRGFRAPIRTIAPRWFPCVWLTSPRQPLLWSPADESADRFGDRTDSRLPCGDLSVGGGSAAGFDRPDNLGQIRVADFCAQRARLENLTVKGQGRKATSLLSKARPRQTPHRGHH